MIVRTVVTSWMASPANTRIASKSSQVTSSTISNPSKERKRLEGDEEDEPEEEEEEEVEEEDPTVINDPKERELELLITANHVINF